MQRLDKKDCATMDGNEQASERGSERRQEQEQQQQHQHQHQQQQIWPST